MEGLATLEDVGEEVFLGGPGVANINDVVDDELVRGEECACEGTKKLETACVLGRDMKGIAFAAYPAPTGEFIDGGQEDVGKLGALFTDGLTHDGS